MKKKVILSYDYELFFGERSGTVLNSLIKPTNKILDAMESVGFRGNFFVDVLMIKFLRQNNDTRSIDDLKMIEDQLRDIVRRGHRIELHLHPHWVDAKYNGDGTWNYDDFHHYSLSSFKEEDIISMFIEGAKYLNSIGSEIIPNYKVCAFRAGGWAVQPFKKLKKAFISADIFIDSSSAKGVYAKNTDSFYDFRDLPDYDLFRFDDDVCVESIDGRFIEVPISTMHRNIFDLILNKLWRIFSRRLDCTTDGTHLRKDTSEGLKRAGNVFAKKLRSNYRDMCAFSLYNPLTVFFQLLTHHKRIACYIDHPKDYTLATTDGIRLISYISKSLTYEEILKLCQKS